MWLCRDPKLNIEDGIFWKILSQGSFVMQVVLQLSSINLTAASAHIQIEGCVSKSIIYPGEMPKY